jgi:hypothetical protein
MLYPQHIRFDGGFVCGPLRNRTDPVAESFPPGTRVFVSAGNNKIKDTIQNLPLPFSPLMDSTVASSADGSSTKTTFTILLDDGTTVERQFEDLIDKVDAQPVATEGHTDPFAGLPAFLSEGSKVTIDHNSAFHKGFIHHSPSAGYRVTIKRNLCSSQDWSSFVSDNILLPGHTTVSSFLRSNTSNNEPSANFVSAKNLLHPCPPSLLKAFHPSNPDRDIWLQSYNEEKGGYISLRFIKPLTRRHN